MGVVMKGGTSGNRQDALPPVPSSGTPQPVLNTAGSKPQPGVSYASDTSRPQRHGQHRTADFMPTSGAMTSPDGSGFIPNVTNSDVMQQDIMGAGPGSGNHASFKGVKDGVA